VTKSIVLIGGGGHAAVLAETLKVLHRPVLGFTNAEADTSDTLPGEPAFLGDDSQLLSTYGPDEIELINGLGSSGAIGKRETIFNRFTTEGYGFTDIIHPAAYLSPTATYGQGLQMIAGAIVNTAAQLGNNVLINSRALVEHHCFIGNHSHIASGAVLCGACRIGESVHVGAGAVINQGITVGNGAIIASGAVVIKDVPTGSLVAGVPAQGKR